MSQQDLIQSAMAEMFVRTSGFTLERHMGPKLVDLLFGFRNYTISDNKPERTKYHENGIDIYVSTPGSNHALEFTTDASKGPEDDYKTVWRDSRPVDVYWFITTAQQSDPTYPNCDVTFEGVGSSSLIEAISIKSGTLIPDQISVRNLEQFADLTGYEYEVYDEVDFGKLAAQSFGCTVVTHPTLVAMCPESHHAEFMRKLDEMSQSLCVTTGVGGLHDFLERDANDPDLYHLRIDTHLHTLEVDTPTTAVNPPPEMPDEIQVDLSNKGVDDSFVPIRLCDGTEMSPQKLRIEPMDRFR